MVKPRKSTKKVCSPKDETPFLAWNPSAELNAALSELKNAVDLDTVTPDGWMDHLAAFYAMGRTQGVEDAKAENSLLNDAMEEVFQRRMDQAVSLTVKSIMLSLGITELKVDLGNAHRTDVGVRAELRDRLYVIYTTETQDADQ